MREHFPILQKHPRLVYLDTAATSQKPRAVIQAVTDYYEQSNANVHRGLYELATKATDTYEQARETTADFLNAKPQEIVFTKSATEALNLLASTLPLTSDSVIILSELEHHANIVPWQQASKRTGATIKWIPVKDYELDVQAAKKLIKEGCDVLAVTHQSNVTGAVTKLQELTTLAHQQGSIVVADGSQAVAHQEIDVKELSVDAYVFSAHKVYGPTGIGVLYAKQELLQTLPPYQTGGEMIDEVTKEETTFAQPPGRFEAGTPPIAQAAGLDAALKWFVTHRVDEQALTKYLRDELQKIPRINLLCAPNPLGCVSFTLTDIHPADLASYLDTHEVAVRAGHHCTQPLHEVLGLQASVRASLGIYTQRSDVDKLVQALKQAGEDLR